jgi:signal transduction histidine kinase
VDNIPIGSLPASDSESSRVTTGSSKVVVVEDERVVAKDLRNRLAHLGIEVAGTASSGETAITLVEESVPDLVLMDIHLKGKTDGIDAAAAIRQKFGVPTVYLTAHSDEFTVRRAGETEPLGYLVKPISDRDLRVTLELAFERRRHDREQARMLAELHAARLEAEQANRAKDEFLAILSHELRSPMQTILGWSAVLEQGGLAAERAGQAVAVIARNARHEARLIDDLLDASRIVAGKFEIDLEPADLGAIVQETTDALAPDALGKSLSMVCQLEDCGFVIAHAPSLRQVFTNLLTNAIKFSPEDGRIDVRAFLDDDWLAVTIRDQGEGIAPDVLPHIFDGFRQADASTTRKHGGLGLGLAIAKHIVELHGGTIEAASAGIGHGAMFKIRLRPAAAVPSTSAVRRPGPALVGASVLVVDDDQDARDFLAFVLSEQGASVHVASSAKEAASMLGQYGPEILITDLSMPVHDGFSTLQHLRALGRPFGAILLTGYADAGTRHRALDAGFDLHLAKPVDPDELVQAVQTVREQERH